MPDLGRDSLPYCFSTPQQRRTEAVRTPNWKAISTTMAGSYNISDYLDDDKPEETWGGSSAINRPGLRSR